MRSALRASCAIAASTMRALQRCDPRRGAVLRNPTGIRSHSPVLDFLGLVEENCFEKNKKNKFCLPFNT